MNSSVEVRKENIRVELKHLEDDDNPDKNSKWYGVWSASFSFHRKKLFAGRELDVWTHWFSLPTVLKLDAPRKNVQERAENFLLALELNKDLLPKDEKDFGPAVHVDPSLLKKLTDIAKSMD